MSTTLDIQNPQALFAEPEYRVEGPLKVTGAATYTADVSLPGMLWLAYTRSPRPHARIVSVDTSAAKQVPGVHAVLTGVDIGHVGLGRRLLDWPALATDRVRLVGDPGTDRPSRIDKRLYQRHRHRPPAVSPPPLVYRWRRCLRTQRTDRSCRSIENRTSRFRRGNHGRYR